MKGFESIALAGTAAKSEVRHAHPDGNSILEMTQPGVTTFGNRRHNRMKSLLCTRELLILLLASTTIVLTITIVALTKEQEQHDYSSEVRTRDGERIV